MDELSRLQAEYDRQMVKNAEEREKIIEKIGKAKTTETRAEYQKQLKLFDDWTQLLTRNYFTAQSKIIQRVNSSLKADVQEYQSYVLSTVGSTGNAVEQLNGTLAEHTASQQQALSEMTRFIEEEEINWLDNANQITKEWVMDNADNISTLSDTFGSMASIVGSASEMMQQEYDALIAKGEKMTAADIANAMELAEKQRVLSKAQIILNEVMSIGNALVAATSAAAQSGIAAPIVFAATLATLTASIVATIASLKSADSQYETQIAQLNEIKKSKGYATGGYVEGAGTATSDSIPARLSNGEAVINARSTAMYYDLLSAINQRGGGIAFPNAQNTPIIRFAQGGVATNTAQIVEAVKTAVSDIQPVVSVKEITRVQNRIKAKETI